MVAVYVVAVLWPFPLLVLADKPGVRTPATIFAAGVGFTALTALVLQLLLPSRARAITSPFGIDLLVRVHRGIGGVIVILVFLHIVVLLADDPVRARLLDSIHARIARAPAWLPLWRSSPSWRRPSGDVGFACATNAGGCCISGARRWPWREPSPT